MPHCPTCRHSIAHLSNFTKAKEICHGHEDTAYQGHHCLIDGDCYYFADCHESNDAKEDPVTGPITKSHMYSLLKTVQESCLGMHDETVCEGYCLLFVDCHEERVVC